MSLKYSRAAIRAMFFRMPSQISVRVANPGITIMSVASIVSTSLTLSWGAIEEIFVPS